LDNESLLVIWTQIILDEPKAIMSYVIICLHAGRQAGTLFVFNPRSRAMIANTSHTALLLQKFSFLENITWRLCNSQLAA
jgi:hypothetical protein